MALQGPHQTRTTSSQIPASMSSAKKAALLAIHLAHFRVRTLGARKTTFASILTVVPIATKDGIVLTHVLTQSARNHRAQKRRASASSAKHSHVPWVTPRTNAIWLTLRLIQLGQYIVTTMRLVTFKGTTTTAIRAYHPTNSTPVSPKVMDP